VAGVAAVLFAPGVRGRLMEACADLGDANSGALALAASAFGTGLVCSGSLWRVAVGLCGGRLGTLDACARYGTGSLVNTFLPARAGDALRVGLLAEALPAQSRTWGIGSAFGAVSVARGASAGVLLAAGTAAGALPLWPVAMFAGLALATAAAGACMRGRNCACGPARLLAAFAELGRRPRAALPLFGWAFGSMLARVSAAAAACAAVGVAHPVAAALLIVPALQAATILPITPGNLGIASGAIAVALHSQGVAIDVALAAGIAFHAVETVVGVSLGLVSIGFLAWTRRLRHALV